MIYCYFGSDPGLTQARIREDLKRKLKPEELDSIIKYDGLKNLVSELVFDASSISLFSEKKIFLFQNAYFFTKSTIAKGIIKESDQDYKGFVSFLNNVDPSYDIYFVAPGDLDGKSSLVKALKDIKAYFINCSKLSEDDYIMLAFRKAKEQGKDISKDAASLLYDRCKDNYLLFNNELDKLLLYNKNVREDDVKLLVYKPLNDKVYFITNALVKGQIAEAYTNFIELLKSGELPMIILSSFATLFRNMFLTKILIEKNMIDLDIAKELAIKNPKSLYYTRKNLSKLTSKKLLIILSDLSNIEFDSKIKGDDITTRLELFIVLFKKNYLPNY